VAKQVTLIPGGKAANLPLEDLLLDYKKYIFQMSEAAGSGYIAQGLCSAEMMAGLFFRTLRLDPQNFENPDRDRFLLSVGHYAISVYAAMVKLGCYSEDLLDTYSFDDSIFEMIATETTPGIEISGGALGQGLSRGVGVALAGKLKNASWKTYVYMSDGEMQEGQVWEAAMVAGNHKLDNLITIVDVNGMQVDGRIEDVSNIEPLADKWKSFGWNVVVIDGNNLNEVLTSLEMVQQPNGKPSLIIANTVMGNGISFLHGKTDVHYVKWNKELSSKALSELTSAGGKKA
jgi:transketolase